MTEAPAERLPLRSVLLLATGFGLATGWVELALRAVQKFVLGSILFQSRHIVWMAPLSDLILFLACGLLLYMLGRLAPRLGSLRAFVFMFSSLLVAAPLTSYPRIHWAAGWVLALGAGWRASALLSGRERWVALGSRVATGGLGVLTLVGLGVLTWGDRRGGGDATVSPADAPNVLLVVWDTVRDKSVDLHGAGLGTTPTLAALAESGLSFDLAMATSSWTLPSHASLFTGRFPDEFEASWEVPLGGESPTLAEVLRGRGFDTAGFAANLLYCTWESGLARGFDHYEDYPLSLGTMFRSAWLTKALMDRFGSLPDRPEFEGRKAGQIRDAFLSWLDGRAEERPFFAFLNLVDAHDPYTPPDDLYARFGSGHPRAVTDEFRDWTPAEIEAERTAYEAEIALLDRELGLLLEALETRGLRDNTLIIVTSDHGELFGEHGLFNHGNALYRPLLHVPLVMSLPSTLPAGVRIAEPVSIAEIPATVMSLVQPGAAHPFPGTDISGLAAGDGEARPARASIRYHEGLHASNPLSRGDMSAVITGDRYYIRNGDGTEEVYRLSLDPAERSNEAENHPALVARLRALVGGR